jgi:hypothetical protein
MPSRNSSFNFILVAGLAITVLAYWNGLHGNFMFDDFQTLQSLGELNGVRNWQTFLFYLDSGHAGPTGRPISMLSYLLNATTWPADPFPFKVTNLILHLICGALLFKVMQYLVRIINPESSRQSQLWIATLATCWWLLNPLHVSTTLYVVQRMAQLTTFFALIGMLGYLHGRSHLNTNRGLAYSWMTLSILIFGALATLSKENGVLLPLFILLMETILLGGKTPHMPSCRWRTLFLWVPSIAVISYLLWIGINSDPTTSRNYTIMERLLTEARILWSYLYQLTIPRIDGGQFYGDDIVVSRSLFSPFSTFPALITLIACISACWIDRARVPMLSFAFLFFLAGHLVESTTIPLELYFEHRNYLPSMFLALPVSSYLVRNFQKNKKLVVSSAGLILLVSAICTWQRANLWGNTEELYLYWAEKQPYSVRAQTAAISVYLRMRRPDIAAQVAEKAVENNPDNLLLKLQRVSLPMPRSQIQPAIDATLLNARKAKLEQQSLAAIQRMTEAYEKNPSLNRGGAVLKPIIPVLLSNPNFYRNPGAFRLLHQLQARHLLADNQIRLSINSFSSIPQDKNFIEPALLMVSLMATKRYYAEALKLLKEAKISVLRHLPAGYKKNYYLREIQRLEVTLNEDLRISRESPKETKP